MMGYVLTSVLNAVNPFHKTESYSDLQCAVINVPLQNGVAIIDFDVAFETDKVGVSSAGTLDFGKEEIDLTVKPKAKGVLSIGIGALAGLVRVRGTWADPQVAIDPKGTAKTAIRTGIDIATGGLTLLADRLVFTPLVLDAPCKAALKKDADKPIDDDNRK